MIIAPGDPRAPGATALLKQSHALMQDLFEPEDNSFLDIEELCAPNIRFFIAKDGDTTLGTAALAIKHGYGEVKSMFVDPDRRGTGIADALMEEIITAARTENLPLLRLETGRILTAALKLYTRHGFSECGIFGDYQANNSSLYMEKLL